MILRHYHQSIFPVNSNSLVQSQATHPRSKLPDLSYEFVCQADKKGENKFNYAQRFFGHYRLHTRRTPGTS